MTIPHLKERIEYAREELAWLEKGAPEGEEPWRGWDTMVMKMPPSMVEGASLNLDCATTMVCSVNLPPPPKDAPRHRRKGVKA
jgi:hypothetical protein